MSGPGEASGEELPKTAEEGDEQQDEDEHASGAQLTRREGEPGPPAHGAGRISVPG